MKLTLINKLYINHLSTWEYDFIESIHSFSQITPKQVDKLDEIWDKVRGRGKKVLVFKGRKSIVDELYNDVHDFDK